MKYLESGPYLAFVRSSLLGMLAYRLRYVTGILTYVLYISIQYFIWQAVFANSPEGSSINGYALPEMITYVVVAWVARSLCFSNLDWDLEELVRSGQVSVYLLRPVNFQLMLLAQGLGEFLFRLVFFTLPILVVVVFLFPVALPPTTSAAGLFLVATVMGFIIFCQINFLVGIVAFYTTSVSSLIQAKHFLIQLLSGLLLPLSFFPVWAGQVLGALPFQYISYVPLQFYLGKATATEGALLLVQGAVWMVILHMLGALFWQRAAARLTVQGG